MENREVIPGGTYRHYKNKLYRVVGVARHSETLEQLVVYEALYPNERSMLWVRPVPMFLEQVEVNGSSVPRFSLEPEILPDSAKNA